MPLKQSKHHHNQQQQQSRRFSSLSNKLTGFRRPHQTVPSTQLGSAELIFREPSATLDHPHHYHSLNPDSNQKQSMFHPRQQPAAPRVRFAGYPNTPSPLSHPHHQHQSSRDRSWSQSSSSTASHHATSSNNTTTTTTTTGNLHSNPVSIASSRSSFDLEPSGPVAEWCHQMHILQLRRYDWCAGCFPRPVSVKDEEYVALQRTEEVEEEEERQQRSRTRLSGGFSQAWEEQCQRELLQAELSARRDEMVRRVRESRSAAHAYQ